MADLTVEQYEAASKLLKRMEADLETMHESLQPFPAEQYKPSTYTEQEAMITHEIGKLQMALLKYEAGGKSELSEQKALVTIDDKTPPMALKADGDKKGK